MGQDEQSAVALIKTILLRHLQVLCGKVSGATMFTTGEAVVIMTKTGSSVCSLLAIRPRKKVA